MTSRLPKTAGCRRVERPHRASPNSKGFHTVYTAAQGFPGSTPKSLAARGSEVPHRHQGGGLGFCTHMGGPTLRIRVPHSIHDGPRVSRFHTKEFGSLMFLGSTPPPGRWPRVLHPHGLPNIADQGSTPYTRRPKGSTPGGRPGKPGFRGVRAKSCDEPP